MPERTPLPADFRVLQKRPSAPAIEALRDELALLLQWQRELGAWPRLRAGLDATPFVSLYAEGRLLGCFGSPEGDPRERVGRAFLRALEDQRFGGITAPARARLAAQVSYPRSVEELPAVEALERFELGTHGVLLACEGRVSVVLAHVARDQHLSANDMLAAASRKAGLAPEGYRQSTIWLVSTIDVVAHSQVGRSRAVRAKPARSLVSEEDGSRRAEDLAARWLSKLVARDGQVTFAVNPRTAARLEVGDVMHHGRAAVVAGALAEHGGYRALANKAVRRLAEDARSALAGREVPGWPKDPALVAGTLALCVHYGVALERELADYAAAHAREIDQQPWHAAQVACALPDPRGKRAYRASTADLHKHPWAPWTLLAARIRSDGSVIAQSERGLVDAIRADAPHVGGARTTAVPEIAQTAVTIEALAQSTSPEARAARRRARQFLLRWQFSSGNIGAAFDVGSVEGAFPISPIVEALRADVTGHALLALLRT